MDNRRQVEALRAANRGMARAVCQGAKTAKRYAALGAGMEVDAQGYGREPTAMVRGVLSCLFVCLFLTLTTLTLFPPILLLSLSLLHPFSQHLSLSFPFSLSNYLSFTHFYLSPISYTRIHSPFPIHSNHSLFYSQATHKSNTHHEHHSSPVIRFQ